jgi:hypothetical protein
MTTTSRKILQIIPAGNWMARFKQQAKEGSEHIDETLVCWALVQSDSDDDELSQVVGMVRSISKSPGKIVFADEEQNFIGFVLH